MKVSREEDNALFTLIKVKPWPDDRWAAYVAIIQEKQDGDGQPINHVRVSYGVGGEPIGIARVWANAILRACDIAEQLEREGAIVLDGEVSS